MPSPTPRGGGIAIVVALLVAACVLRLALSGSSAVLLAAFAIGLVLVAGVGWIDDHRPLSPWLRLAVHAWPPRVLALARARRLAAMPGWRVAARSSRRMVLVNVWNFMDGIDGLAASQAALVAAGAGAWWPAAAWALAGAGAGRGVRWASCRSISRGRGSSWATSAAARLGFALAALLVVGHALGAGAVAGRCCCCRCRRSWSTLA